MNNNQEDGVIFFYLWTLAKKKEENFFLQVHSQKIFVLNFLPKLKNYLELMF